MRVPLPAARMTTWRSISVYKFTVYRKPLRQAGKRGTAKANGEPKLPPAGRFAAFGFRVRDRFEGRADAVELTQCLQIGVVPRE